MVLLLSQLASARLEYRMENTSLNWSFGDPTGWTIACIFFVAISSVIGGGIYGVSYRLLCMGSLGEGQAVSRRFSLAMGFLFAVGIFIAVYLSTLSGFLTLELHDGQLTLRYILPERTVILPVIEVMTVQEEPAYKGRWRLILSTETSGTYESALAVRTEVHRAGEALRQRMVSSNSPRR
jgi:hypothetical protein